MNPGAMSSLSVSAEAKIVLRYVGDIGQRVAMRLAGLVEVIRRCRPGAHRNFKSRKTTLQGSTGDALDLPFTRRHRPSRFYWGCVSYQQPTQQASVSDDSEGDGDAEEGQ